VTQIAQFVFVLVIVAVASMWTLAKGRVKWFLLIVGAFVAWVVLPSVILQVEWGYYNEDAVDMGGSMRAAFKADSEYWAKQAAPLVAETCGDADGFDVNDPSLQWVTMPEQDVVKHFFFYGKYSNVIWLGVGWKDRFCLARYLVVDRKTGDLSPLPTQLFPYPFFPWFPHSAGVEERLIERLPPPPKPPEGVRPLLPGQCVTGEIAKGETARFQVQVPYFGQEIKLDVKIECTYEKDLPEFVEWKKNGHPIAGLTDDSHGGGTYWITLRAPTAEAKRYKIGVLWGTSGLICRPWLEDWGDSCHRRANPSSSGVDPG